MISRAALFILGILVLAACSPQENRSNVRRLSADHLVQSLRAPEVAKLPPVPEVSTDAECAARIRQIMCVSNLTAMEYDTKCDIHAVTADQVAFMTSVMKALPPFQRKVMCHVNRIQVQDRVASIAYAMNITDEGGVVLGSMIGVRGEVLRGALERDIYTWKEQLNFGLTDAKDKDMRVSPEGPRVLDWVGEDPRLRLGIFIHEINHLIDFINQANSPIQGCLPSSVNTSWLNCMVDDDSFTRLSWGDVVTVSLDLTAPAPRPWIAQFPLLANLCYYWCTPGQKLELARMYDLYQDLARSTFVTAYSSANYSEDFAEVAMYWTLMKQKIPFTYRIVDPKGLTLFDGERQLRSNPLREKRQWLERFFNRRDLKYRVLPPAKSIR